MAATTDTVPFKLDGKSAIVTGAGSGINLSFAKILLERQCNVVFADLALRPEAKELVDQHSRDIEGKARAVFVKTDVTIWDQLTNMFDVAEKEFGGADIVCPGAGIFEPEWTNFWNPPGTPRSKDILHGTPAGGTGHYACLDINLTHPIRTTQLAISRFLNPSPTSKAGKASLANPKRIVHVSSIAGQAPGFWTPMYVAAKHGVNGFVRSMAPLADLGIVVNGVAPGVIKTPLWMDHPEKLKMVDLERDTWVEPEEVAEQMVRCLEDEEVGAGTIWEVLKGAYRKVDWRMDAGPTADGAGVSNRALMFSEAFAWLGEEGWGVPVEGELEEVKVKAGGAGGTRTKKNSRKADTQELAEGSRRSKRSKR